MNAIGPDQAELVVGLVNNMTGPALRAADIQFTGLLHAAGTGLRLRLRRFAAGPVAHPGYEPIDALWRTRLDGLIVTGAEPQAASILDEPAWPLLATLVDWAPAHTRACIWSCLAAHAAVFRLDGLTRRRLPEKLSGVFQCTRAADSDLVAHAPASWPVPHSRFNDLDLGALERAGYTILSRGPGWDDGRGADAFEKRAGSSAFLLLQGHPEYAADGLMREYRRDLRRYLDGARGGWPKPPSSYFNAETEAALARLAALGPGPETMAALDAAVDAVPAPRWRPHSVRLFGAWLAALAAETTVAPRWSVHGPVGP